MISKIGRVTIYVDDQESAVDFWTSKVGFVVKLDQPMGPGMRWIEVGPEGGETTLVLYPKDKMEGSDKMKPSLIFECDDMQRTFAELSQNGVQIDEPQDMPYGKFAMMTDPDGNRFGLRQPV